MAARVEVISGMPVVKRQDWKALEAHSKQIRESAFPSYNAAKNPPGLQV
jgi:hypothetical protein